MPDQKIPTIENCFNMETIKIIFQCLKQPLRPQTAGWGLHETGQERRTTELSSDRMLHQPRGTTQKPVEWTKNSIEEG